MSPYPVVALLGALVFVLRHERGAPQHQRALLDTLRSALGGRALRIEATIEALRLDDQAVSLDAPGSAFVCEQMLLLEVRSAVIPGDVTDEDLLRFATVLGGFPGTYPTFANLVDALGPTGKRIALSRASEGYDVFGLDAARPHALIEPDGEIAFGVQRLQSTELDPTSAAGSDSADMPSGGVLPSTRPGMSQLLLRCREAIERQDWEGALDAAVEIVESENDDPAGLAGSLHRIEFKRLMTRRNLALIARLARGERKQEAITVLRRFGGEGTEVLMDLLVEAGNIGERRCYYSALIQMSEGTTVIVQHLDHPQWYVVRNAADLCGELALSEAIPALAKQTRHHDERVRKAVAEALGKIGTPVAMETLASMLNDPAQAVRLQAVAHLRGRRVRGMISPIGELLQREEDAAVQQEALLALGRIGTPEAVNLLRDWASGRGLLRRRSMPTRLTAIRGLALAGPGAVDALSSLQRDSSAEIRDAATAALTALPG
jgi:HEAT repeat protein